MDELPPEFLIERYSVTDLNEALSDLIQYKEGVPAVQRGVDEWTASNPPPEPPERFEGARALMDYLHVKAEYERKLEQRRQERDSFEERYREKARGIAEVLPEGIPLIHHHFGHQYEIVREAVEGAGDFGEPEPDPLTVRKLD